MEQTKQNSRPQPVKPYVITAVFLLLACAAMPPALAQQWQTNGDNSISNTNTGNVGIGTTSPGSNLTVVGNIAAEAVSAAN